jgi:hypothetical protein
MITVPTPRQMAECLADLFRAPGSFGTGYWRRMPYPEILVLRDMTPLPRIACFAIWNTIATIDINVEIFGLMLGIPTRPTDHVVGLYIVDFKHSSPIVLFTREMMYGTIVPNSIHTKQV